MELTQTEISRVCKEIEEMLLEKNRCYGDSAINPLRIFSRVDAIEQIDVRIDDKLSRIARGSEYGDEDTEADLIGYLILKRVARRLKDGTERTTGKPDQLGSSTSSGCACQGGKDHVLEKPSGESSCKQRGDRIRGTNQRTNSGMVKTYPSSDAIFKR